MDYRMACSLCCLLLPAVAFGAAAEPPARPTCEAGGSECMSGLVMLQKATMQSKAPVLESSDQQEHPMQSGLQSWGSVDRTVYETGTMLLQKTTLEKKTVISQIDSDIEQEANKTAGNETIAGASGIGSVVLGTYPGYNGTLEIKGSVNVHVADGVVSLSWLFTGLGSDCQFSGQEARKMAGDDQPNSCGLHFHEGTTCEAHEHVGGHHYDHDMHKEDPWAPVVYVADKQGTSVGFKKIDIGHSFFNLTGHAFVVHDYTGGRVACGLLQEGLQSGVAGPASVMVAFLSLLTVVQQAAQYH